MPMTLIKSQCCDLVSGQVQVFYTAVIWVVVQCFSELSATYIIIDNILFRELMLTAVTGESVVQWLK